MIILGLDTATPATAVALLDTATGDALERRDDPPPGERPRHTTRLLGLVHEALTAAGIDWDGVGLIAVGIGPGTFTGLRIGVTSARALAAARELPIVAVSSLRALASAATQEADAHGRDVLAVLDARRREVFAAGWATPAASDPTAPPQLAPRALAPAQLADELAGDPRRWLAVGDGAIDARAGLERAGVLVPEDGSPLHRMSALAHCRLAVGMPPGLPAEIEPDYLRVPDAELTRRATAR